MIDYGEPLHIYGMVCLIVAIAFMLGIMCGSLTKELEKEQKNTD
ncbi:hypothetical protein [Planomicrobium okeanokoites]|nr:hypothetical protein [Planomicrobium okeanokoites]